MTLSRDDFGEFFAETHNGHQPFTWQWLLLDKVLDTGKWPDAITAPTGSGKTAVIDVHVFALALAADRRTALPPRRLSMVVDRRVLVDDQYGYARNLAERLARENGGVVGRVADALWTLQGTRPEVEAGDSEPLSPLLVSRLRGGERPSLRWVDHPSAAAVLCSTPDMWGSRLLFRGYGSWSRSWPREAGLLAFDSVAVVDEAHLSRQLLYSARRVSTLAVVAEQRPEGPQPLQVVETTATPAEEFGDAVGVTDTDLHADATLADRLLRPKPVTLSVVPNWAKATHRAVGQAVVGHVVELVEKYSGTGTVGCFVNTVARAVTVAEALRSRTIGDRPLKVVMICGQIRRADIDRLTRDYPGLLTVEGNPNVDVLVSTQSLEVGVDLDLSAMVTELAPASAIVQRAGRVNRRGQRESGPIIIVGPSDPLVENQQIGPYKSADLESARLWVQEIASTDSGLSPWAIRNTPLPATTGRRTLLQRPEVADAWTWARTSDDIVGDPDLDLWLSDDLEPDYSIGIVVRAGLPTDPAEAIELLAVIPPRSYETFVVPWSTAKDALEVIGGRSETAYVIRGESISVFDRNASGDDKRSVARARPGNVIVIGENVEIFSAPAGYDSASPPVVAVGNELLRDRKPTGTSDVLEHPPRTRDDKYTVGTIVRRIELNDSDDVGKRLLALLVDNGQPVEIGDSDLRDLVQAELQSQTDEMSAAAADLLGGSSLHCEAIVLTDVDDLPVRIVVIDRRRAVADEYVRQEWTPSHLPVPLVDHQKAVAQEIGDVARRHGVSSAVHAALEAAALHHDDGKADPRFQVRLEARPEDPVLAKSHRTSIARVGRRPDRSGLPAMWRHEQLSVVLAWSELAALDDRNLAARLVGTTHGFGRSGFPHGADELIGATTDSSVRDEAVELFDVGLWDELIETTHRHHGIWYCAYLEALLRAADGKISGEGR